jgi:hypothetical protein
VQTCPLCERAGVSTTEHHFIPRAKGGKEKTAICIACHNTIHDLFTNNELRDMFNTPEALRTSERFAKYLKWIRIKPVEYIPCFKKKK